MARQTTKQSLIGGLRRIALGLSLMAGFVPCLAMLTPADRPDAERSLMQGRVDEAVALLKATIAQSRTDGRAHLLLCRAYYSELMADLAVAECEAAVQNLGSSSEAQDWMGRAYGIKANESGPIAGYKLAHKVRDSFETAVTLGPKNSDAANDLGEYYVTAPSIVGGGTDKAADLATRIELQLPQAAHRIRALIAEKEKDHGTAEREFRAAVGVAGRADAWADLGNFYARRNDPDKALDALQHCLAAEKVFDASAVDAVSILTQLHRDPKYAERLLRMYLDKGAKSDAAPAFKVQTELAKILAEDGDKTSAKIELQHALALAANYDLAKRALQKL